MGYAALAAAVAHMTFSVANTEGANTLGIWFASLATAGLALQAFSGTNLQSPGVYRPVLRRWHGALFWTVALLAAAHVALNG